MAVKAPVAKKSTAKKEIELVAREYRLLRYQPLQFVLKVGRNYSLLVFDPATGLNRAIRHCPAEKSIYIDEQSENAVVQPVIFLKGLLSTKGTDVITQTFLDAHPSNGGIFEMIDVEADSMDIADLEELKLDVKQAIRDKAKEEAGLEELKIIVAVLTSNASAASKMTPSEIKNSLYELVDQNVGRFVDDEGEVTIFDDIDIKRQAITQQAFNSGVIQVSADGSKVMWSDNKASICLIPTGQSHLEFFAKYLGTEEGLQVAVEISKR
tara:strand:- start:17647 stop:18447 length:801 start_codon:yes stop_codon:yes gene_type:complete